MEILNKIQPIGEEKIAKLRAASAYSLPINPAERGLTPEQIRERFYRPIVGQTLSLLTELDRVITEANDAILVISKLLAGESVGEGKEARALEELILLSKQGMTLKGYAERLDEVYRSADEIFSAEGTALAASQDAERAKEGALEAKEEAEAARDSILAMRVTSKVVPWSETPTVEKTEIGSTTYLTFSLPAGRPFRIARTFSSVEEMNAGAADDGVEDGQYVMVDTGNVEDSENACLYFKQGGSYHFITDLSGAPGISPVRGVDYFTPEDMAYFDAHIDERLGAVGNLFDELHAYAQELAAGGDAS